MEAICSSETSAGFQLTTRRCIPEDSILHNHHCENLKSYLVQFISSRRKYFEIYAWKYMKIIHKVKYAKLVMSSYVPFTVFHQSNPRTQRYKQRS
jgi:hypothetical protein